MIYEVSFTIEMSEKISRIQRVYINDAILKLCPYNGCIDNFKLEEKPLDK